MQLGLQVGDQQKPGAGPFGWWWLHGWDGRLLGANLLGLELDVRSGPMSQLLQATGGLGKGAIRG